MPSNPEDRVTRRIRLDLSPEGQRGTSEEGLRLLPYEKWLQQHVAEVTKLRGDDGRTLVEGCLSKQNITGTIFVTDFTFANRTDFDEYNRLHLDTMRKRILEAYPHFQDTGTPFEYKFAELNGSEKDSTSHDLLEGTLFGTKVIATSGCYQGMMR